MLSQLRDFARGGGENGLMKALQKGEQWLRAY